MSPVSLTSLVSLMSLVSPCLRSPSLMSASFSMRETLDGGNFTWTSAGPTADGDIGKIRKYSV